MGQRKGKQNDFGFGMPIVNASAPDKNKKALNKLDLGKGRKPTLVKRIIGKIANLK